MPSVRGIVNYETRVASCLRVAAYSLLAGAFAKGGRGFLTAVLNADRDLSGYHGANSFVKRRWEFADAVML